MNSEAIYDPSTLYEIFKHLLLLGTRELARRLSSSRLGLAFYSVDPGFTWTDLYTGWGVWVAGPLLGAAWSTTTVRTQVWLAGGRGTPHTEGGESKVDQQRPVQLN